jgi:NAD-dependent dihydropyrimidine dehydrogenase PreA subunit
MSGGVKILSIKNMCHIFAANHCYHLKHSVMAYKITDDCTACGTCIDECPVEAISEGDIYVIDPDICTDCGSCADVCPVEAIEPE